MDLAYKKNWTDAKIITSMFQSSLSSEECIIPLKENGPNKLGNKIVFCNNCVRNRKEIPYDLFIKLHPEMVENLQKQMNIIANEILKKNLKGNFRFYRILIANKFKEISNGVVNIDLVDYSKEILKESKIAVRELENKIRTIEEDRDDKILSITQFPALKNDFLARIEVLISKKQKIQEQINTERSLQSRIATYLNEWNSNK